jgi:hypothetical protein
VKRAGLLALALAACSIPLRRDLSRTPPQQIVFDDVCGVQAYHDAVTLGQGKPPRAVSGNELELSSRGRATGGVTRFAFEDDFQLRELRRVLGENWKSLPAPVMSASRVDLEVQWAEKAGVKRVVTTSDAKIIAGDVEKPLAYNVCLSELLFGAPLYRTRREVLGLPPLTPGLPERAAPVASSPAQGDGGPPPSSGP